jgi:hypothetical protein
MAKEPAPIKFGGGLDGALGNVLIVIVAVCVISAMVFYPRDNTTAATARTGGMIVLTDEFTGCQYLYKSGIAPRMDATGKQVCNK